LPVWSETWRRDVSMMRDAGIAVVRLGHLAWDTFEPADGEFRFERFDEVMDLMRNNGIGVILDIAVRPAPLCRGPGYGEAQARVGVDGVPVLRNPNWAEVFGPSDPL
jgi:beta-galactosidase GanA